MSLLDKDVEILANQLLICLPGTTITSIAKKLLNQSKLTTYGTPDIKRYDIGTCWGNNHPRAFWPEKRQKGSKIDVQNKPNQATMRLDCISSCIDFDTFLGWTDRRKDLVTDQKRLSKHSNECTLDT